MNILTLLFVPLTLFTLGIFGIFINRKNILLIIVCVELILLSLNLVFLIASYYLDDALGQIFTLFILTVASAESSIGLAILVIYYRVYGTISIELVNSLKG